MLKAVEDTLIEQNSSLTPVAYFAALLSLLSQNINSQSILNKDAAYAVIYLLDLITPEVPAPLLRSRFSQVITNLAPALTHADADAPLIRSAIGCLESVLVVQDASTWAQSQSQISPRRAVAGLLSIAVDSRPKVRKRAQDALVKVLKNPPPSPSLDHPAADMCAESALRTLQDAVLSTGGKKNRSRDTIQHEPILIHSLQLVRAVADASGGWPSKKIDALCELLLNISRSSDQYLTMAAFDVFEAIFLGMTTEESSPKLPHLLEVITELQPSRTDTQLLPPWIAVLSRGIDVSAQVEPEETFSKLPEQFSMVANFLDSPSHNIRISASECLVSFLATGIPNSVLLDPSIIDEKVLERLARHISDLLSVQYQAAWMEVFNVLGTAFDVLRWRASPILSGVVKQIGELRTNDAFTEKEQADVILSKAVRAMGPDEVLKILPLNLGKSPRGPGRAWLLPLLRTSVANTKLAHFNSELVPLSKLMFQRVLDHQGEKTMEIKVFETIVQQIWSILPGYCDLPIDLRDSFDQPFAELLSNLLYQQTDLRTDICHSLQNLVETNKVIADSQDKEDLVAQSRVSKADAKQNLAHLSGFANNLLAVLFNIYSQTLPAYRGPILLCINAYLSIVPPGELIETFTRVNSALEAALKEDMEKKESEKGAEKSKQKPKQSENKMPPMSHTLMDLVITITAYLPRETFASLFNMASLIITSECEPQLQKKAYKLIPRLSESAIGCEALVERNVELQRLLLDSAENVVTPARRDRLAAISKVVEYLPRDDLHFIPSILPEVVIGAKEVNEKARTAAYDLLVSMGDKMRNGGTVANSKVSHMPADAPDVTASLEEYFTMVSAGLAASTPHMVSASITAVTRIFYQFRSEVSPETISNILELMDMFIQNNNREVVRSVIGFVKVAIISLPQNVMQPRLKTLIPNLLVWSHEHKSHFKAKVKHIIERMIRRFGIEIVERFTPEEDKRLIINIRKSRDRRKRKQQASVEDSNEEHENDAPKRKGKFESEFDEAVYGSESESESSDSDHVEVLNGRPQDQRADRQRPGRGTYIVEDEDEPLDLLDKRSFGNISSTKPLPKKSGQGSKRMKAEMDLDGKLLINDESSINERSGGDKDINMVNDEDMSLEAGINAYVQAIRGKDAAQRGQKGKLKFSNKRRKDDDGDMDMDDEMDIGKKLKDLQPRSPGRGDSRGGSMKGSRSERRGLGIVKTAGRSGGSDRGRREHSSGFNRGGGNQSRGKVDKFRGRGIRR